MSATRDHTLFGVLSDGLRPGSEWYIAKMVARCPTNIQNNFDDAAKLEIIDLVRWTHPNEGYEAKGLACAVADALNGAVEKEIGVASLAEPIWSIPEVYKNQNGALPIPWDYECRSTFENAARRAVECVEANYARAVRYAEHLGQLGGVHREKSEFVLAYLRRETGVDFSYILASTEGQKYEGFYRHSPVNAAAPVPKRSDEPPHEEEGPEP